MSSNRWPNISYLEAIRPEPGWKTELALLSSYSVDLIALGSAILALAGCDDDRGSGSRIDFATAVKNLKDRVRVLVQAGHLKVPSNAIDKKILVTLDGYIREVHRGEYASWHPKCALVKHCRDDGGEARWRLWIGSRNLTRDLSWDVGLTLAGDHRGSGAYVPGISELAKTLVGYAKLGGPRVDNELKEQLDQVRWEVPDGCELRDLRLLNESSHRGLPQAPTAVNKVVVVSPFINNIIREFDSWGGSSAEKILVSTREQLAQLALKKKECLAVFNDLRYIESSGFDPLGEEDVIDVEDAETHDEEPEPRGLHAKIIYAESASERCLWVGSANATSWGWNHNDEIVAQLKVTKEVAEGLEEFIGMAKCVSLAELEEQFETPEDEEQKRLESAKDQVVRWLEKAIQKVYKNSSIIIRSDPNPVDYPEFQLKVGRLGSPQPIIWPRGAKKLSLPQCLPGEVTELIQCRLESGQEHTLSWLQRIPVDPELNEDRNNQALARYLGPHRFLFWVKAQLNCEPVSDGGGDWYEQDKGEPQIKTSTAEPPSWPTIEEVLKAWARDPEIIGSLDNTVKDFKRYFEEHADSFSEDLGDLKILQDFYQTWKVIRRELAQVVSLD